MEFLLAAAAEIIKFESAILVVVLVGLIVLAKMVSDLRAEVSRLRGPASAAPAPRQEAASQSASPASPASEAIEPDVFAAIVSAVHFTLGENHHVVSISPAESMMWSREGRRSIFGSHSVR